MTSWLLYCCAYRRRQQRRHSFGQNAYDIDELLKHYEELRAGKNPSFLDEESFELIIEHFDEKTFYETALLGQLVWGDLEFGRKGEGVGRKSYLSKLVTQQMTRIVNITPLLNHNLAGVSGSLWSLAMGSVDNTIRFENDADRLAAAVPEIIALPSLGDRVVLNVVDALLCQYQGEEQTLLHYSVALNQLWFSTDPVALDLLSIQEIARQRKAAKAPPVKTNLELYRNAALLEIGVSDTHHIDVTRLP